MTRIGVRMARISCSPGCHASGRLSTRNQGFWGAWTGIRGPVERGDAADDDEAYRSNTAGGTPGKCEILALFSDYLMAPGSLMCHDNGWKASMPRPSRSEEHTSELQSPM